MPLVTLHTDNEELLAKKEEVGMHRETSFSHATSRHVAHTNFNGAKQFEASFKSVRLTIPSYVDSTPYPAILARDVPSLARAVANGFGT